MATKMVSFDKIENLLGVNDFEEISTNVHRVNAAKQALKTALRDELTDRQRECVTLYYFNGMTEEQTANELGITKSTVCRHLQKAKRRLYRVVRYAAGV